MRRAVLIATLAMTVAAPVAAPAQGGADWRRYVASGAGVAADVPTGIFRLDNGPAIEGTGRRFATEDGRADLTIAALPNLAGASPAAFLAARHPPAGIIYRRVTPRFFVVSSVRQGRIWYNRCNRAPGAMHCVFINYPVAEKRQWDGAVTRISRSLSGGR